MSRRQILKIGAGLSVALCLAAAGVAWRAQQALQRAAVQLTAEGQLGVEARSLTPLPNPGFQSISAPAVFASAAYFDGRFYLMGPAGVFAWTSEGALEHVYRPGQDFPASAAGAATVGTLADARQPELLFGTDREGVIAFDGKSFRQIRPADSAARQVTALLALRTGQLLWGTAKRGLLIYDGRTLRPFHPTTSSVYVTALAGTDGDLWVGTLNHGLLHWHGGETEAIGVAQGLPDARIEAIAIAGGRVYAATPVGVAEMRQGRVSRILAPGRFARAVQVEAGHLLVGQVEEGVFEAPLAGPGPSADARRPIAAQAEAGVDQPSGTTAEQFLSAGGHTYAVAEGGLLERGADGTWNPVLKAGGALLGARHISALLPASDGRLWVGYFDRGLDILPPGGGMAHHIEDDHVFCINRIVENPRQGDVVVATANGLVLFDRDGRQRQVLERAAGLIADHVTDVALYRGGLAAATPAGITFLGPSGTASVYTFQGLINDHVYALGVQGEQMLAGTLGGLSLLQGESIRRNITMTDSGLRDNWITSMVRAGDSWLIGTYGSGVMRMEADGTIAATEATRAGTIINFTAMLADGKLVLAGTLDQGLLVGDASGQHWRTVTAGLPSLNVTALAAANGTIYVGTESGLVKIEESRLEE
ncbi:MAG TPA: hypothetical protein VN515_05240 [Terriglobales bacterium]|nr:hypothetical protein [Terriglobales bacterium]